MGSFTIFFFKKKSNTILERAIETVHVFGDLCEKVGGSFAINGKAKSTDVAEVKKGETKLNRCPRCKKGKLVTLTT